LEILEHIHQNLIAAVCVPAGPKALCLPVFKEFLMKLSNLFRYILLLLLFELEILEFNPPKANPAV
jgi:hypothetical protein